MFIPCTVALALKFKLVVGVKALLLLFILHIFYACCEFVAFVMGFLHFV